MITPGMSIMIHDEQFAVKSVEQKEIHQFFGWTNHLITTTENQTINVYKTPQGELQYGVFSDTKVTVMDQHQQQMLI